MGLLKRMEGPPPASAPTTTQVAVQTIPGPVAPTLPAVVEEAPPIRRPAATSASENGRSASRDLKARVQEKVIADLDPKSDLSNEVQVRQSIQSLFDRVLEQEGTVITR